MTRRRLAAFLLGVVGCSLFGACAGRRELASAETTPGPPLGVYRGRLVEEDGTSRRFRLLLFVALPDRVHGEVVSPVGSTVMIVDGGAGRLAVTLVREGISYVGEARPEILERVLGVRLSLAELVRGFLDGMGDDACADCSVTRSAEESNGLPRTLEFRSRETSLRFELKKVRPLDRPTEALGTGRPPDGTALRDLEQLGQEHRVGDPEQTS